MKNSPLRVLFCWSDISGYMAACWREMTAHASISVKVLAYGSSKATSFSRETMAGIDWEPLDERQRNDAEYIASRVASYKPDVVVLPGWLNTAYNSLAGRFEFAEKRFVMTMDTPWTGSMRQRLAPLVLRRHLRRMDKVVVTGERAYQYAVRLGVPETRIARGLYGVDHIRFGEIAAKRIESPWPRRFLFVGRYAEEKALDVLVEAYRRYRVGVADPFDLVTCGQGELASLLEGVPGIEDKGFMQPEEIMNEFLEAGCFVMASRFDPWPLALVEASATGLPVLASSACGSAVENLRDHVNGFVVATGDAEALSKGMAAIHASYDSLADFGVASRQFAAAYSAQAWVRRWLDVLAPVSEIR